MRLLFTATDHGLESIGSRLIRAYEGGLASHCGAVLTDGRVVDATWPKGVQAHSEADFLRGRTLAADLTVELPDETTAAAWLEARIGEPYDVLDIVSFLLWRDAGRRDRYVCSSLLLRAMLAGGLQVHERHDRWGVRHALIDAQARAVSTPSPNRGGGRGEE